jgi:ABC-type multidrug transport system fused ATPase/permease subunit
VAEYVDRYDVGSLESTERKYSDYEIMMRLIKDYVLKQRGLFLIELGLIFAKMALVLIGPYLYKITLDYFIQDTPTSDGKWLADLIISFSNGSLPSILLTSATLFGMIGLLEWLVSSFQFYYLDKLGFTVIADIREHFFRHLNNLSQRFFEYGNTGKLVSRVTNDAEALKKLMTSGVIGVVADLLMAVSSLLVMLYMNRGLTFISLLIAPILMLVSRLFQGWISTAWRTARRNIASLTGKVQDLMYGAKVTKALTQEERSLREFDEVNEQNMVTQIRAETVSVTFSSVVIVLSSIMTAAIWYIGGNEVLGSISTLGELVAFSTYTTAFFAPIQSLSMFYGDIQSAISGAERIFTVLDMKPEVDESENPVTIDNPKGVVEVKNVDFTYVDDIQVLNDVSFTAEPGTRVALFGPTGSGKSTIINLLGRFYDPTSGVVTIDGVDIKEVSLDQLRRIVSIVLQEPFLFSGTIEYNLKFSREDATDEEMERVARLVGIHEMIERLPDAYQTGLKEHGSNLSFGQRQLICLGRAILADPKILVFDEATSSVDPYTEAMIQKALMTEMENRTVIIVTHRVSTVRDSDKIILLDEGKVTAQGTHDELLESSELYKRLCEMQLVSTS